MQRKSQICAIVIFILPFVHKDLATEKSNSLGFLPYNAEYLASSSGDYMSTTKKIVLRSQAEAFPLHTMALISPRINSGALRAVW